MKDVKQLVEYVRNLVLNARGNVVSFTLRQVKRALGAESKLEERTLRAALETLASLGLLQKTSGRKPRYLLQRGTPTWSALERGCTDLLAALADRRPGQPNAQPGPAGAAGVRPPLAPRGASLQKKNAVSRSVRPATDAAREKKGQKRGTV